MFCLPVCPVYLIQSALIYAIWFNKSISERWSDSLNVDEKSCVYRRHRCDESSCRSVWVTSVYHDRVPRTEIPTHSYRLSTVLPPVICALLALLPNIVYGDVCHQHSSNARMKSCVSKNQKTYCTSPPFVLRGARALSVMKPSICPPACMSVCLPACLSFSPCRHAISCREIGPMLAPFFRGTLFGQYLQPRTTPSSCVSSPLTCRDS